MLRNLVIGGGLLVCSGIANAQTVTLLDSIGTGSGWRINASSGNFDYVGYDPNANGGITSDPTQAGYAVIPVSLTGASATGSYSISSVSTVLKTEIGIGNTATLNNLYGSFVVAGSSSINAQAGTLVGGFFQFNLTPALNASNTNQVVTASGITGVTLNAGTNYWLVLSPDNKFGTQSSDGPNILNYVNASTETTTRIGSSGGSLSSSYATEGLGLGEVGTNAGANPGDLLTSTSATETNQYFGATIVGNVAAAGVPESSTVVTALLGLVPVGGLLLRRRTK
jgi:hypothetical protein